MQPEAFADLVVSTVKNALAPIAERLAATEALLKHLGDLRDRVVTVETKQALSLPAGPAPVVDLAPVLDRIGAIEQRPAFTKDLHDHLRSTLIDLRDRVVAVETKAALPVESGLDDFRDRLVTLETRTAGPSLADMAVTELRAKVGTLEAKLFDDTPIRALAAVSERVAVLEVKAPVAGPPGKDGANGADGLGFDDLSVGLEDRTLALKFTRAGDVKVFAVPLPFLKYQGVFSQGKEYTAGDVVTWGGSTWTCSEPTTAKPGEQGSKAWTLCVKRGQDGKDGKEGPQGPAGRDLTKEPPAWRS